MYFVSSNNSRASTWKYKDVGQLKVGSGRPEIDCRSINVRQAFHMRHPARPVPERKGETLRRYRL